MRSKAPEACPRCAGWVKESFEYHLCLYCGWIREKRNWFALGRPKKPMPGGGRDMTSESARGIGIISTGTFKHEVRELTKGNRRVGMLRVNYIEERLVRNVYNYCIAQDVNLQVDSTYDKPVHLNTDQIGNLLKSFREWHPRGAILKAIEDALELARISFTATGQGRIR